jgi:hypothetical protein
MLPWSFLSFRWIWFTDLTIMQWRVLFVLKNWRYKDGIIDYLSIVKVFTDCEQLPLLSLQSDVDDDDVIQMYLPPRYLDGL